MYWARIEGLTYSICLVSVFLAVGVWESVQPTRQLSGRVERRWKNHGLMFLIGAISTLLLRSTPVALAVAVSGSSFGLLNKSWLPVPVRVLISILLLDAIQYWIHSTSHRFGWLWRIHQVHHSDPDYDVSTAGRFHPLEVLWTQGLHLGAIALLAPPPVAVFISVLLIVTLNLTTHANASLPAAADRILKLVFVTPDMHRIHHSHDAQEQQRNFGQTFALWDRLFGTYRERPAAQGRDFKTGLEGVEVYDSMSIGFMLAEPFQKQPEGNPPKAPDPPA
jgi:sterol desaturase/sphingolipid hydroxylase (fatty acid hydroxylase superfamily)